jgi:hypothetical protein
LGAIGHLSASPSFLSPFLVVSQWEDWKFFHNALAFAPRVHREPERTRTAPKSTRVFSKITAATIGQDVDFFTLKWKPFRKNKDNYKRIQRVFSLEFEFKEKQVLT